jgi:hypothetical protein
MKPFWRAGLFAVVGLVVSCVASAQTKTIEGVPIGLGDSVEKVKTALGTTMEPEPIKSVFNRKITLLRVRTKGISAVFNEDGKVESIRLDAPFAGNVGGVKIGDARAKLMEKLGKPVRVLKSQSGSPFKQTEPYIYYVDDRTTVRFDFDRDDEIETMFILK